MTTDDYLATVTVGERAAFNGTIGLVPHDPGWALRFASLAEGIRKALGTKALLLEHVGSTAVPGLVAKPVIDIVLAVSSSADEAAYVPSLLQQGFVLRIREPSWFEHRLLKTPDAGANLHVFSAGCEEIDRMLAFRDWLRAQDDDRRRYEAVKQDLAARTWKHVQDYADAKTAIVSEILSRAYRRS